MRDKITVLFLASDPFRGQAALRLDEEVRAIDRAIQRGGARERVELVAHFATRTRDLQNALMRHDPRIVHFAGHGGDPGVLYLGDERGRPRPVGKEALGKLFSHLTDYVKVVILNGCDTLPTVDVLGEVVDYAIGMNRPLSDASAIVFAEAFYGALAMGRTVRASFDLAVIQMEIENNREATTPVLRIRPGVDPAVPLVTMPAAAPAGPAGGGAGDGLPVAAGQVNTFDTLRTRHGLIESGPGETRQRNHFGDATIDHLTIRGGLPG